MARKAGSGDAATTASEGPQEPASPTSSELPSVPDEAVVDPSPAAEAAPVGATGPETGSGLAGPLEPRAEALSAEGLGAGTVAPEATIPLTGPLGREPAAPEMGWGAEPPLAFREDRPKDAADVPRREAWAAPMPPRAEATSPTPPAAAPSAPARRGGFGGAVLGGLLAASLGFGAAWVARERLDPPAPDGLDERLAALEARPQPEAPDLGPLAQRVSEAEARLAALEEAPPTEPAPAADLSPMNEGLEALGTRLDEALGEAQQRAAALEERLASLEARPAATPAAETSLGSLAQDPGPALATAPDVPEPPSLEPRLAAVEEASAGLRSAVEEIDGRLFEIAAAVSQDREAAAELGPRVQAVEAALEGLAARLGEVEAASSAAAEEARAAATALAESQARASAAETQARRGAVLAQIESALAAGDSFEAPLTELGPEAPEVLARAAAEGVPSLATLREAFPEAARAGLETARAEGLAAEGGGVGGFLWGQLSLRSTSPREGDDPDAVLSRAEAALAAGRLEQALAEVAALPEPVQAAMGDWVTQARARAEVEAALAALREGEPAPAPAD